MNKKTWILATGALALAALTYAITASTEKKAPSPSPETKPMKESAKAKVTQVLVTLDDGKGGIGKPTLVDKVVKTDDEIGRASCRERVYSGV